MIKKNNKKRTILLSVIIFWLAIIGWAIVDWNINEYQDANIGGGLTIAAGTLFIALCIVGLIDSFLYPIFERIFVKRKIPKFLGNILSAILSLAGGFALVWFVLYLMGFNR